MSWLLILILISVLFGFWWITFRVAKRSNEAQRKFDRSIDLQEGQLKELQEIRALLQKLIEK